MKPELNLLTVEWTKLCNLKCIMCVSHGAGLYAGQADKQPGFMDQSLFESIVDQYTHLNPDWPNRSMIPQFQGEPTIHPKFLEYCEIMDKADVQFSFTTNALKLSREMVQELVKLKNFRGFTVSMDGATKETYERIRLRSNWETVLENCDLAFDIISKENLRRDYNRITTAMSYTDQPENDGELKMFVKQWIGKVNYINVNNVAVDGRPQKLNFPIQNERVACGDLWHFMVILTDGKCVPCCRDYLYELEMGNVSHQSLKEVWFGEKYERFRSLHENGEWSQISLCDDCDSWACRVNPRKEIAGTSVMEEQGPFYSTFRASKVDKIAVFCHEEEVDPSLYQSIAASEVDEAYIFLSTDRLNNISQDSSVKYPGMRIFYTPTLHLDANREYLREFCSNMGDFEQVMATSSYAASAKMILRQEVLVF